MNATKSVTHRGIEGVFLAQEGVPAYVMKPEFLTVTQAAAVIGQIAFGSASRFGRQHCNLECRLGSLVSFLTPLGRLIHILDIQDYVANKYPSEYAAYQRKLGQRRAD